MIVNQWGEDRWGRIEPIGKDEPFANMGPEVGRYRVSYAKDGKRLIFTHAPTWEKAVEAIAYLRSRSDVTAPRIRILGESHDHPRTT